MTPAHDRYFRLMHLQERFRTATCTASQIPGLKLNPSQTVTNRLHRTVLQAKRPMRRNVLTARHLAVRLRLCRQHIRWRRAQWRRVLFSDESCFMLFRADGRSRIFRRNNERYAISCVLKHDRFGVGSVNVHVLPWPARSADLSPIEHFWDIGDGGVCQGNPLLQTLQELFMFLFQRNM